MSTNFQIEDFAGAGENKLDSDFASNPVGPMLAIFAMELVSTQSRIERVCFKNLLSFLSQILY